LRENKEERQDLCVQFLRLIEDNFIIIKYLSRYLKLVENTYIKYEMKHNDWQYI